jgi:ABC-2 type transport system permease protein
LTWFILRRDRKPLIIWVLLAVSIPVFNAFSLHALLPTQTARDYFAKGNASNPITSAILGPLSNTSMQGIVAWRSSVQCVLVAGLASLLLVIRHTRAEEDAGRRELVGSTVVGRQAGLTAALSVVVLTNLLAAVILAAVLISVTGYAVAGSFAFALTAAATGCVYAAIAGTVAQLAQSAALARGMAVGALGATILPRVAGASGRSAWLAWFSGTGWMRLMHAFAGERWWVLLVPVALAALLTAVAYGLSAQRDLGAGMLLDRAGTSGRTEAAPSLSGPLGLAWRQHRGPLTSWVISLAVISVMTGQASSSFDQRFGQLGFFRAWLAGLHAKTVGDAFLAIFVFVLFVIVACLAIIIPLRAHAEERKGYAGFVLATPTARSRWLGGHVLIALAGPSLLLLVVGLGTGLAYAMNTGRPEVAYTQLSRAMLGLPAVWVMAALAVALYGRLPRITVPASWGVLVGSVLLALVAEGGVISRSVFAFTPLGYDHPMVRLNWLAPITFTVLAAILVYVGISSFRRRDLMA